MRLPYDGWFILTGECNMRCGYCLWSYKEQCGRMSTEVLLRGLALLATGAKLNNEVMQVHLFGGEPFLMPELIELTCQYCEIVKEKDNIKHMIMIHTNGYEVDLDLLRRYKHLNLHVSVSIDGIAETHDKHRKTVDGLPTHQQIIDNAEKMMDILGDARVFPQFTVNPRTAKHMYAGYKLFKDMGFKHTHIIVAKTIGNTWTDDDYKEYWNASNQIADDVLAQVLLTRNLEPVLNHNPLKKCLEPAPGYCGAGDTLVAITPDGDIYPCATHFTLNREECIGNVWHLFNDKHQEYLDKSYEPCCGNKYCFRCGAYNKRIEADKTHCQIANIDRQIGERVLKILRDNLLI